MLICDNVSCAYGNHMVFEKLGFTLSSGALLVLRGPNGSGKTSLLKMLAGLSSPLDGSIYWDGFKITDARQRDLKINFLGHKLAIKGELTVWENLEFWASLYNSEELVPPALAILGLKNIAGLSCSKLSSGWQKRVALARLICCPANLWLLDEPYNNLDSHSAEILDELIEEKCNDGGIVIISSHSFVPHNFAISVNLWDFSYQH